MKTEKTIINKELSQKVVMTGVKYTDNHPGGISSVVRYWSEYIEDLQYYAEFEEGSNMRKLYIFAKAILCLFIKLITDKKVKIVHIHTAETTDFKRNTIILYLAKFFRKKTIMHSHGATFVEFYDECTDRGKNRIVNILNKLDYLIVLSESWKKWFVGIGVDESKLIILHNITSYPQYVDINDNVPVKLLFLGEIGPRKGVFDVLSVLASHKDEFSGVLKLHIGGNKMEKELRSFIAEHGLNDFVVFDGFVHGELKTKLLNWANLFILPSFNEGLPISILEAMAYRLPIISTPVGGIPEVVDETNGILVTPGNHNEIYKAIKFYVDNLHLISVHGENSYKKAETYMPDYVLNHLKEIYLKLL